MQAGYHLPSKRQDYHFIKSHGRQWYTHHENKPNVFTLFRSHFDVLYTMSWKMVTICPGFTSLVVIGNIFF